jgi:hypothetical protein
VDSCHVKYMGSRNQKLLVSDLKQDACPVLLEYAVLNPINGDGTASDFWPAFRNHLAPELLELIGSHGLFVQGTFWSACRQNKKSEGRGPDGVARSPPDRRLPITVDCTRTSGRRKLFTGFLPDRRHFIRFVDFRSEASSGKSTSRVSRSAAPISASASRLA